MQHLQHVCMALQLPMRSEVLGTGQNQSYIAMIACRDHFISYASSCNKYGACSTGNFITHLGNFADAV